ncbi:MAG: branched-chain amino acid ABC transporter permease [Tateyamaria sp.]|jgi:predicted branched-subunit amino acid permease|nr:branched-chain amino acid ABC transporter permease [Tateyamaria sp.]
MPSTTTKSKYWSGMRDSAPFLLIVGPFSILFGVLATEAGLNIFEVMSFSLVVIAGAAQFTALQLMQDEAPTFIILISALAVNLRVAMYSAALTPYLGQSALWQRVCVSYLLVDQNYALSHTKFEAEPTLTTSQRLAYYFGTCSLIVTTWLLGSYIGAALGFIFPQNLPLDLALPIAFLSMIAPMMRTLPHLIAATVAIMISIFAAGMPYSFGLILAGLAGMITGAKTEVWLQRRLKCKKL